MRHLPLSPNGSPCRHSCSLSSYSPCGCKGDPSKMQIQSHHALIKTFQRLPVNFRAKSQLPTMASEVLQDPKAAYLPTSLLLSCAMMNASVGPQALKRLLVLPNYDPIPGCPPFLVGLEILSVALLWNSTTNITCVKPSSTDISPRNRVYHSVL